MSILGRECSTGTSPRIIPRRVRLVVIKQVKFSLRARTVFITRVIRIVSHNLQKCIPFSHKTRNFYVTK